MSDITNTRDAAADLAVCAAATPGPWTWEDGPATVYSGRTDGYHGLNLLGRLDPDWNGYNNLDFIAMARAALPHWIERAEKAERECQEWLRLARVLNDSRDDDEKYKQALHAIDEMRLGNGLHEAPEPIVLQLRTDLAQCQQVCQSLADRVAAQEASK